MNFVTIVLFFIAAFVPLPTINGWVFRQFYGLSVVAAVLGKKLSDRFHWSVGLCFLITALNAIFQGYAGNIMMPLLFVAFALALPELDVLYPLLGVISLVDAAIICFRYFSTHNVNNAWWVLTSASLDASFLALTLPINLMFSKTFKQKFWVSAFIVITIFITRSNTGIFTLFAMAMAYLLNRNVQISFTKIFISGLIPVGGAAWLISCHKFLDDNSRFKTWVTMMSYWKDHINPWIGSGPGTFWNYAAMIQPDKDKLLWMHNDWLQQLFVQGIVGFVSMGLVYFFMLKTSYKKPHLFSMVVGYGVVALTLFPNHLFFFQVLGVSLIGDCFKKDENICPIK